MKFRFPIVIIDEDFRSENTSRPRHPRARQGDREGGHGGARRDQLRRPVAVRAAAEPRLGVHPVDRRRGVHARARARPGGASTCARSSRRSASRTRRSRSTCTARRAPRATSRTTSCASCTASSTCSRTRRSSSRATSSARPRPTSTRSRRRSSARWSHYAQDGSYSWHCPGHSGGVAFLKSPVGQMFHQFFGENMLRADVCNAVDELGQLLDHTGPVAASERNAARIFNADHCFFVTNGTSTSNKMVWHATVAPDDIVVVDRNCHVSILHAITMTGAIPVFLTPTRNHLGIIGPIPLEEFRPENIAEQDRGQSVRARGEEQEAAHPDHHAEHLRRHRLQRRDAEGDARTAASTRCTSTRRGCRTRRSTSSTRTCTRSARTGRAPRTR